MIALMLAMAIEFEGAPPTIVSDLRAAAALGELPKAVSATLKRKYRDNWGGMSRGYDSERRAFGPDPVFVIGVSYELSANSMYVASKIRGKTSVDPIVLADLEQAPSFDVSGEAHERNGLLTICAQEVYGDCSVPVLLQLRHGNHRWKPVSMKVLGEPQLLEAEGPPKFARLNEKVDTGRIIVKYREACHHLESGRGPWIFGTQVWQSKASGFHLIGNRRIESPLKQLDRIAGYRQVGDWASFNAAVPSRLRAKLWAVLDPQDGGYVHVGTGPGPYSRILSHSFWINRHWIVTLSKHKGKWAPVTILQRTQDLG